MNNRHPGNGVNHTPIEDYALIGDLRTAALVSREGSIEWLCFPRFDSAACFASLLGSSENGRWQIQPEKFNRVSRRYREDTLVLETDFETPTGKARLTDCMIPGLEVPTVLRIVQGLQGKVRMKMELVIRFDYGSTIPWVTKNPFGGIKAVAGPDTLRLTTTARLVGKNLRTYADFEVREGESVPFVLTWSLSHDQPPSAIEDPIGAVEHTTHWWREWISHCIYTGPYKEAVRRSLITLKALTHHPTGGIVAAPTTSLPESIAGIRNWDYRYSWVRDSTLTLSALIAGGYREEAQQWRNWLLRAVAGNPAEIRVIYGVSGERRIPELTIPWLTGYEGSRPVRIGNAAYNQLQLDIFGVLLESLHLGRLNNLEHDNFSWNVELQIMKFVETAWKLPDQGLWESRGPARHYTHSKVMAWTAMDRAIKDVEICGCPADPEPWRRIASEIRAEVCAKGFDPELNSFVQYYGSKNIDASGLLTSTAGFLPPDDPRVLGTVAAVSRHLMKEGFVLRYITREAEDGLPGQEGAFIPCTLWLADNLYYQGRTEEAVELFERVLSIRNDLGLLSEEYDPVRKRLLGNFPQAFSHLSLLHTAFLLETSESVLKNPSKVAKTLMAA